MELRVRAVPRRGVEDGEGEGLTARLEVRESAVERVRERTGVAGDVVAHRHRARVAVQCPRHRVAVRVRAAVEVLHAPVPGDVRATRVRLVLAVRDADRVRRTDRVREPVLELLVRLDAETEGAQPGHRLRDAPLRGGGGADVLGALAEDGGERVVERRRRLDGDVSGGRRLLRRRAGSHARAGVIGGHRAVRGAWAAGLVRGVALRGGERAGVGRGHEVTPRRPGATGVDRVRREGEDHEGADADDDGDGAVLVAVHSHLKTPLPVWVTVWPPQRGMSRSVVALTVTVTLVPAGWRSHGLELEGETVTVGDAPPGRTPSSAAFTFAVTSLWVDCGRAATRAPSRAAACRPWRRLK